MKLCRSSRLLYLLGGIAVTFILADFGYHGTPGVLDVSQLESFTGEHVSVNKIMQDKPYSIIIRSYRLTQVLV